MAKKVYKYNDYYGYINKIQSMALSNPEWFWGDSADAAEARQWLYDNNAGAIIDEIYDYTPEDIKKKIPYKKLTTNKVQEVYNQGIRDTSNEASKYVAGTLAASVAAPYIISAFPTIASEVAATSKFLATPAGKAAMSKLAADMAVSTAVGETVNESARLSGYNGFGDLISQSVGVDPKTKGYNFISGAADFLNPGYIIGGSMANRVWNATRLGAIESNSLTAQAIERNKALREVADNAKQRLSDTFGDLKTSIVKRINRAKDKVATTEVPETIIRPDVTPIVTAPESVPVETRQVSAAIEPAEWTPKEPLSAEDYSVLSRNGLGIYDIENLRQRGYTPEQLRGFDYPATPGTSTNARANIINSALRRRGVHPEAGSRADFTREAIANQPVYHAPNNVIELDLPGNYRVGPGQPVTMGEIDNAIRDGILPVDFDFSQLQLASPESINYYYSRYPSVGLNYTIEPRAVRPRRRIPNLNITEPRVVEPTSPISQASGPSVNALGLNVAAVPTQWLPGSRSVFDDALQIEAHDLNKSLSTLSKEEFRTMAPVIKDRIAALRDRVLSSGQTPSIEEARSMIKQELTNLYRDKYNKLYKVELPNFTNMFDRTSTSAVNSRPIFRNADDALKAIFKDGDIVAGHWNRSNPTIAATPYTAETVPLEFVSGVEGSSWDRPVPMKDIVGSYTHFSVFGRDRELLSRLNNTVFGDTATHGKLVYEGDKSLDSTKMFNRQAYKSAKTGKGVILFDGLKDIGRTDNKYNYVHTNDFAGTLYRPYRDAIGTIEDLSTQKITDNVKNFSQVLKYTDPRIFKAFGGTPEFKAIIQRPDQSAQYIDLPYRAVKNPNGTTDYVFDFLTTDAAGNHTSEAWKILDDFDQEMLRKKNAGESLKGYKLGMLHPLTGFRSFKQGGILKRK